MINLFQRVKNLWILSEYRVITSPEILDGKIKILTKDIPTVKNKMAKIILPENNIINEELKND